MPSYFQTGILTFLIKFRLKGTRKSEKHQKSKINVYSTVLRLFKCVVTLRKTTVSVFTGFIHIIEIKTSNFIDNSFKDINKS